MWYLYEESFRFCLYFDRHKTMIIFLNLNVPVVLGLIGQENDM